MKPAPVKTPKVTAEKLQGFKHLKRISELLVHLHRCGCDRDKAGNRHLHFDDYVLLLLLFMFNPMIDSMRILQQVASLPEVQKKLGVKRFSLGSFSESCTVFKPEMLQSVVAFRTTSAGPPSGTSNGRACPGPRP